MHVQWEGRLVDLDRRAGRSDAHPGGDIAQRKAQVSSGPKRGLSIGPHGQHPGEGNCCQLVIFVQLEEARPPTDPCHTPWFRLSVSSIRYFEFASEFHSAIASLVASARRKLASKS